MSNKELIIALIQQDLKHSQLVSGLDSLGLEASDKHCLQILEIVSELMGVPVDGEIEFAWGRMYVSLMAEVVHFEVEHTADNLRSYAETCYQELCSILK